MRLKPSSGFTLLEITVALVILGISTAVIMEIFSNGLIAATKNRDINTAMMLAQSKMEETLLEKEAEEGQTSGSFEGMSKYKWTVTISEWEYPADLFLSTQQKEAMQNGELSSEDKDSVFRMMQIKVTVSWQRRGKELGYSLVTLKTLPPEEAEELPE